MFTPNSRGLRRDPGGSGRTCGEKKQLAALQESTPASEKVTAQHQNCHKDPPWTAARGPCPCSSGAPCPCASCLSLSSCLCCRSFSLSEPCPCCAASPPCGAAAAASAHRCPRSHCTGPTTSGAPVSPRRSCAAQRTTLSKTFASATANHKSPVLARAGRGARSSMQTITISSIAGRVCRAALLWGCRQRRPCNTR